MSQTPIKLDIHKILELLPHRYPILLVDRVLELEPHKRIKALKNVSINEPYFQGHFPKRPVMPGVLILEALAQTAALLTFAEEQHDENTLYYFVGIDGARFKRVVEPGDQMMLHVEFERYMRGIWKFKARAEVDGVVAAEADLMCTVKRTGEDAQKMSKIHPTAIVEPGAQLDASVEIAPYAIIGAHVTVGAGTTIGSHTVVEGHTTIGEGNVIGHYASIGGRPQDMKYRGEPTRLVIGDRNTIREFTTIHTGTIQDAGVTTIGDENWIMAYVHIGHDCYLGSHIVMSSNAQLAGHVQVGDHAIVGGMSGVHQFVRIGANSFLGGASALVQDLPPFVIAAGNKAEPHGINIEGLRRRGFSAEAISAVRAAYRVLYKNGLTLDEAKVQLRELQHQGGDGDTYVKAFADFVDASTRGIIR